MSAAGPNAPLALAARVALVACGRDDPSLQTEQAEAAYEFARSACQAHMGELREACVRDAECDHQKRIERARSRFRRATMQGSAMP